MTTDILLKEAYQVHRCCRVNEVVAALKITGRTWQEWRKESIHKRTLEQVKTMAQFGEFSFDINKYLINGE